MVRGEGEGELSSFCRKVRLEYDGLSVKVFPPPLPSSGGLWKALSGGSLRTLLHPIKLENRTIGIYGLHSLFTSRAEYCHRKAFFKTKCFQMIQKKKKKDKKVLTLCLPLFVCS